MGRTFDVLTRNQVRRTTPRPSDYSDADSEPSSIRFPSLDKNNSRTNTPAEPVEKVESIEIGEPVAPIEEEPLTEEIHTVQIVSASPDDLPGDDDGIPYIEVGGPRSKKTSNLDEPKLVLIPSKVPESQLDTGIHPTVALVPLPLPETQTAKGKEVGADLVTYRDPNHPTSKHFSVLADALTQQLPVGCSAVLVFTSASVMPHATSTVLNLAITMARQGKGRILVIEVDRSKTSAATRFGVPEVPGLRELLARAVPLTLALHRTPVDSLFLLPAGKAINSPEENTRLGSLLDQLRARFDWILVDAPQWGTHPLNDWAKASDGTYLVVRPDEWDAPQVDAAHEGIVRGGGRLRGCITTRETV